MASYKKKEEERIERAIRALLKLPENRRCINCNSLGPQYVCTTFWTFVCTNCSGIHREFTHRVKSVSIARFTAEEVAALEAAGNGRARQIYFKEFDPERHSFPDGSNLHKLREFIRQVYMDRRFSKESQKLQRLKLREEEPSQLRKTSSYNGRSRNQLYDDNFDPRYRERSGPVARGDPRSFMNLFEERRAPSTARESTRTGRRKSTAVFEIVDNRVRSRSARQRDAHALSLGSSRQGSESPEPQRNTHRSCSPVVMRPAGDGKDAGSPAQNQNVISADPDPTGSANEKQKEQRRDGGNLIDFSMVPEGENDGSAQHVGGSNDVSTIEKASSVPNMNNLEDLLFGLSVTPAAPAGNVPDGSRREHVQRQPLASSISLPLPNAEHDRLSASPVAQHAIIPSMAPSQNQLQNSSHAPNAQAPSTGFTEQSQDTISSSAGEVPSLPSEVKTSMRTELPMDLFANFPEPSPNWQIGPCHGHYPQPVQNWQISPSHGMGYNSPYYQNPQAFPSPARSTNPFDINDEAPESQPPQFPSMDPTGMSYPSMMAPQPPNSFASPRPQGAGDPFASLMANPNSTGSSNPSKGGNPFG